MSDLAADLARIAASRGLPTNYYTGRARVERPLSPQLLGNLFRLSPDGVSRDLRAYDRLPEDARRALRDCPLQVNAEIYGALIQNADGDCDRIEAALNAQLPGQMKTWLNKHYRAHPSLRKYP